MVCLKRKLMRANIEKNTIQGDVLEKIPQMTTFPENILSKTKNPENFTLSHNIVNLIMMPICMEKIMMGLSVVH